MLLRNHLFSFIINLLIFERRGVDLLIRASDERFPSENVDNELYYIPPQLNVKNFNLTIGISSPLSKSRGTVDYQEFSGGIIAAICQADQINQKLYPAGNFIGTINLAVQDYTIEDAFGQNAAIQLILNNMYNKSSGGMASKDNIQNLAGYIGTVSSGRNRINADVSAGFALPMVNPGSLIQLDPANDFSIFPGAENRTFFSIRGTILYSNINAFTDLMKAYNWTIGANIFQNSISGLTSQQGIQTYSSLFSSPIFTCNSILTADDSLLDDTYFVDFCKCVGKINELNVIGLWAAPPISYEIIRKIKKNCGGADKFIFVVEGEVEVTNLDDNLYNDDVSFKASFIIKSYGPWNFTSYLDNCIETGSQQAKVAIKTLLEDVLKQSFNCYKNIPENLVDLLPCSNDVFNRAVPCLCTGFEFDPRYNPSSVMKKKKILLNYNNLVTKLFFFRCCYDVRQCDPIAPNKL